MKKIFKTFVWHNKHPRTALTQLTKPKTKRGVGLPNMERYHIAAHIMRIVDWCVHAGTKKDRVSLEGSFYQTPLRMLPWIPQLNSTTITTQNKFTHSTNQHFKKACKNVNLLPSRHLKTQWLHFSVTQSSSLVKTRASKHCHGPDHNLGHATFSQSTVSATDSH